MDARQWAKELAHRQDEIVAVRSEEYQTKKEIRDAFTCFTLSYPGGSRLVLDPWGLLGHGETDNSEEALEAPFNVIGPEPMDWFMRDILERNGGDKRLDLTIGNDDPGSIYRESYDGKTCRYILGEPSEEGANIIVVGVNPNTADETETDETMRIVRKEALEVLGAKGYVMLNLCPYRQGKTDQLPKQVDKMAMEENLRAFEYVLAKPAMRKARVWAAWGSAITKRSYLAESLRRIVATFKECGHEGEWFEMVGSGDDEHRHPYHPNQWAHRELMPWNLEPAPFDVDGYLTKFTWR